ncbi:hypothetical protein [Nitrobacter sp. JJSN]|uniref:hypothetical protein n=1 Tax=Nitrobacter sp. JJSN TaxID=3453033 RepID=UPI003F75CB23
MSDNSTHSELSELSSEELELVSGGVLGLDDVVGGILIALAYDTLKEAHVFDPLNPVKMAQDYGNQQKGR